MLFSKEEVEKMKFESLKKFVEQSCSGYEIIESEILREAQEKIKYWEQCRIKMFDDAGIKTKEKRLFLE